MKEERVIATKSRPPSSFVRKPKTYQEVQEGIIVSTAWMGHTSMAGHLRLLDALLQSHAQLKSTIDSDISAIVYALCAKGQRPDACSALTSLYRQPTGGKSTQVGLCYLLLLEYDSADSLMAFIERFQDRVHRCESARKQSFTLLVQSAAAALRSPASGASARATKWRPLLPADARRASLAAQYCTGPVTTVDGRADAPPAHRTIAALSDARERSATEEALRCVLGATEHYLDAHKLSAFKSALQEPARMLYHLAGNQHHRDHVNVHGLNGYLCILRGGLGCVMPLLPLEHDGDTHKGCGDHWAGLSDKAWALFGDARYFGKDMEALLRAAGQSGLLRSHDLGSWEASERFVGGNAAALEQRANRKDPKLLPYVARFGHFFTSDFLTRRLFEGLNAESDPAAAGFRRACDVLWPLYAQDAGVEAACRKEATYNPATATVTKPDTPASLVEYAYADEFFETLDVEKVEDFFRWLGVFK